MEVNRIEKPRNITWSNEIQEKIERRGLKMENRIYEPKRFTSNSTIMDIVVKYVQEIEASHDIIAPINQVRISKRMVLPCKLVGFKGERKTKEAANDEDKSCVLWKTKFD